MIWDPPTSERKIHVTITWPCDVFNTLLWQYKKHSEYYYFLFIFINILMLILVIIIISVKFLFNFKNVFYFVFCIHPTNWWWWLNVQLPFASLRKHWRSCPWQSNDFAWPMALLLVGQSRFGHRSGRSFWTVYSLPSYMCSSLIINLDQNTTTGSQSLKGFL